MCMCVCVCVCKLWTLMETIETIIPRYLKTYNDNCT